MSKRYALLLSLALPIVLCAQPVNDLCSDITPEALAVGASLTFSGTRTGATSTGDGVTGNILVTTTGVGTVWHAFTTTECSDLTALYCNTALPATTQWAFLNTTCPADDYIGFSYANFGTFCTNGQFGVQFQNLPPGTYYMPIYAAAGSGNYEVQVSAIACTPGPVNDDCSTATVLSVNTTCVNVTGNVGHATPSDVPTIACNGNTGYANDDVWFAFTATGSEHTIIMDGNGDLDAVMELFTEDCGSDPIACSDATLGGGVEQIIATDLNPGEVYKVRVFHWYSELAYTTSFTICVTGDIGTNVTERAVASVRVQPNPASDRISLTGAGLGVVRILDITGRIQWTGTFVDVTMIDVSAWPRGTYIVSVEFDRQVRTERIILQ
ncbi:MAG: T9SS type A sorting domain-containing protein [Flavobacteriales bacterium]|nr:T9SS type A sorting domain-containing protein [Flavobacteriales bacterium]